ncbi:MAG: glucose dehydrogenase, partial [Gemmatimonadetes bacterium]|nr:PQQ-dependent sugar dehydrogenase [Gemmatimonadota bacterium]NIQ52627.1 PQQ-dependent sugar dehydrogenase [Gemmatimonadota bacterium]NIU72762.1 glucose dehydrogenase [Gammaproteobacteria bacterium]NIX43165.1 glucose dehydrogenase [Gemmatimonadota bacterium]NIY07331.1 glucose dehydrogenase [Gemmatimonadota bacterium]
AEPGLNYGWSIMEGSHCYDGECSTAGLVLPVHEYSHADGCSITGGFVYRGAAVPSLEGRYLFADYCRGWIRSFRLE